MSIKLIFPCKNLLTDIVTRAEYLAHVRAGLDGAADAEVADEQLLVLGAQQQILRLEVEVGDSPCVQVGQTLEHVVQGAAGRPLRKSLLGVQQVLQLAAGA